MVTTKHVENSPALPPCLKGCNPDNYIYITLKERCPSIISKLVKRFQAIQLDVSSQHGLEAGKRIKTLVNSLNELRYKMLNNKPLEIFDDKYEDVKLWNKALQAKRDEAAVEGKMATWYDSDWLFVECYLYRKIYGHVHDSDTMLLQDYFLEQKSEGFDHHKDQILDALAQLEHYLTNDSSATQNAHLSSLIKQCIWGNRCDLSFSGGNVAVHNQSSEALDALDHLLIVNELPQVVEYLNGVKKLEGNRRIDIILDNAGMELVSDLILAEYVLANDSVDEVVIHMKKIPWFVSDVTMEDWTWTLKAFKKLGKIGANFAKSVERRLKDKSLKLKQDKFWVTPHSYSEMRREAPELYSYLSRSHLLIFKGDLNYRKLISDHDWEYTTPFKTALKGFEPAPILALRTMKCAVVAGVSKENVESLLDEYKSNKEWLVDGKHAVLQFNE